MDLTPTATSLVTIRAGRFWDNFKTTGIPVESSIQYTNSSENLPFAIPPALQQPALYTTTPRVQNTYYDLTSRTYFQIDASKFLNFFGQHNLKGGYGRSKTVNKVSELYPGGGYISINWDQSYDSPNMGLGHGTYGYYTVQDIGVQGSTGGTMITLYIQDQWRVLPRLTLTLGLRTRSGVIHSGGISRISHSSSGLVTRSRLAWAPASIYSATAIRVPGSSRHLDWVEVSCRAARSAVITGARTIAASIRWIWEACRPAVSRDEISTGRYRADYRRPHSALDRKRLTRTSSR